MDQITSFRPMLRIMAIALAGWFLFVVSDTVTKYLTHVYPVPEVIFLTYCSGMIGTGLYILARHGVKGFATKRPQWHLARACSGALGAQMVVHALSMIPLADFYGIVFLSPLLLCLLSHFFLGETIGRHRMTAILVGFAGVLVLAGPQFSAGNSGFLFALAAVIFSALNGMTVRKIGKEPVLALFAFYPFVAGTLLNLPLMLMDPNSVVPHHPLNIMLFLLVPPVMLFGLMAYSYAFAHVHETAVIAPFHYSQIIWGTAIGYMLFGDVPTQRTILGAAIIISAGLYMIWREHALHKKTVIRNLQR